MDRIRITDETSEIWLRCRLDRKKTITILREFMTWCKNYHIDSINGDTGLPPDVERSSGWLILLGIRAMNTDVNQIHPSNFIIPIDLAGDKTILPNEVTFDVDLKQLRVAYILSKTIIVDHNQRIETLVKQVQEAIT